MKCCIIGCGWLGKPLAVALRSKGYDVSGSVRTQESASLLEHEGINVFLYDGVTHRQVPQEFQDSEWMIICFPPSKSDNYNAQIAELLTQTSSTTRILFTSTTGVYADSNIVTEKSLVKKDHLVYQAEKKVIESNRQYVILRLAGLIGGERHPINQLAGRALEDGQHPVNLVERNDVIRVISSIMETSCTNELFNVCFPDHPTRKSYYTEMADRKNLPIPIFQSGDSTGKKIDGSRIEKVLNFRYTEPIW
jgi:nucleoside-diphosphate-sugar epimerase